MNLASSQYFFCCAELSLFLMRFTGSLNPRLTQVVKKLFKICSFVQATIRIFCFGLSFTNYSITFLRFFCHKICGFTLLFLYFFSLRRYYERSPWTLPNDFPRFHTSSFLFFEWWWRKCLKDVIGGVELLVGFIPPLYQQCNWYFLRSILNNIFLIFRGQFIRAIEAWKSNRARKWE